MKTIAILTGGGDCPGLNAVIRGVVRAASLQRQWRVIGIEDGYDGLVGDRVRTRELDLHCVEDLLHQGGTILGTSNRGNPFSYPIEKDGQKTLTDISQQVVDNFNTLGADALIAVGGDGTLKIAHELHKIGLPVVGVPKTIDNDLKATDVTFGYRTAVSIVTEALDRLHTTAESHHRTLVVEVMGRDAGWIALESGIAGGADVILLPEIPFDLDRVCEAIEKRQTRGPNYAIVVAAEGAFPANGEKIVQKTAAQNLGIERLGGVGDYVGHQIAQRLDMETRVVTLGHLQRGGSPTPYDRILASRFGVKAVELIEQGQLDHMVSLKGQSIVAVPLLDAVAHLNRVDPEGEMVRFAEALGIMMGR